MVPRSFAALGLYLRGSLLQVQVCQALGRASKATSNLASLPKPMQERLSKDSGAKMEISRSVVDNLIMLPENPS